ncbi:putative major facilitator superfamily, MFS transporter superfamily [Septoria linicola]|nr:putative major facilitator superfamily, MFS transporter superfamily [Septoria linicola]
MAIAMSSLLQGSVTVTSSSIGRDLKMSTAEITWITAASSLSAGAFLLLFGKLADLFGRRALFVGSLFLFSVFALGAGFSNRPIVLDVLNGVLGLFNASAVPAAQGLLSLSYPISSKRRNYAFACFSAGNPLGFAFGAIFGGVAATIFKWRASFWLISIVFFVFTIIGAATIPQDPEAKAKLSGETVKRFDIVGVFCVVFGIGMFSASLSLGDTAPHGWRTGYVLALLIVGLSLLVAFVLWDIWIGDEYALVPMGIWKNRNFSVALLILSLGFLAFTPGTFFYALYLQNVWEFSPIMVAVHLLPMFIVGLIANGVAGLILHKVSNKLLMWLVTACYTVAFLLLALNRWTSSYWAFAFPALILIVIAADLQLNVCNMLVMTSLPKSHQSIAGGIFQTAVRLTAVIGFGVATAVFNAVEARPALLDFWDEATQPYTAVFWISVAYSALSMCLVPFLTLGTQGGDDQDHSSATNSTNGVHDSKS